MIRVQDGYLFGKNSLWQLASFREFVEAIRYVETGNLPNQGQGAIGDKGKALGPLQIHEICHEDAVNYCLSILTSIDRNLCRYEKCTGLEYSSFILYWFMRRYAKTALRENNFEKMARIWNGGPFGYRKTATIPYWNKVRDSLNRIVAKRMEKYDGK